MMQVPFSFQALAGDREGFFVWEYPSSIRTFVQSVAIGSAVFTMESFDEFVSKISCPMEDTRQKNYLVLGGYLPDFQ